MASFSLDTPTKPKTKKHIIALVDEDEKDKTDSHDEEEDDSEDAEAKLAALRERFVGDIELSESMPCSSPTRPFLTCSGF